MFCLMLVVRRNKFVYAFIIFCISCEVVNSKNRVGLNRAAVVVLVRSHWIHMFIATHIVRGV